MDKRKKKFQSFGSRSFILTAAIAVILGGVVSGTVAWMYIKSDPVHNTFTYGDMTVELTESDTGLDGDEDDDTNAYSLTPDAEIAKDPVVTVTGGTEACWVFVKVEESDNFNEYMEYTMAEGWKALDADTYPGVYYLKAAGSDTAQKFDVLEGNKVAVKDSVTQGMLDELEMDKYPTLQFTAYAVQLSEVDDPTDAWKVAEGK